MAGKESGDEGRYCRMMIAGLLPRILTYEYAIESSSFRSVRCGSYGECQGYSSEKRRIASILVDSSGWIEDLAASFKCRPSREEIDCAGRKAFRMLPGVGG